MFELELIFLFYFIQIIYNRTSYLETPEMVIHRATVKLIKTRNQQGWRRNRGCFQKVCSKNQLSREKIGRMTNLWFSLWITKQTPMPQWVSLMPKTEYFSKSNVHDDVITNLLRIPLLRGMILTHWVIEFPIQFSMTDHQVQSL